ncbi:hypothetical protein [Nocardia tengchongensis]
MSTAVGLDRALRTVADGAGRRIERVPSALELFGFGSEDEPPSPA